MVQIYQMGWYIFSVPFPNHTSFSSTSSTVLSHTCRNWVLSNTLCFSSPVFVSFSFSLYNSPQPFLILVVFIWLLKLSFPCLLFYWFIWSYSVHKGKDFFLNTLKDQAGHRSHRQFLFDVDIFIVIPFPGFSNSLQIAELKTSKPVMLSRWLAFFKSLTNFPSNWMHGGHLISWFLSSYWKGKTVKLRANTSWSI